MIEHIYYLMTLIFIWGELKAIRYPSYYYLLSQKVQSLIKEKIKPSDMTQTQASYILWNVLYFLWTFLGVLTSQWMFFLTLIILSLLPLKKWSSVWLWIDALLSLLILVTMLLNKYYLHII